ncbi:transcriptional regulator, partial [Caulobacter hibisci]|nr:transcriptional regulator [Caulobacter hibisci]
PYVAASGGFRGELAIARGQGGEALAWIEESLARLHAARYELLTTPFSTALAEGLLLDGRASEALDLLDAAIDQCRRDGELLFMPELLRIKAAARLALGGDVGELEALLRDAVDWSRRQGARAWELRAVTALARLLLEADRRLEIAAELATLCDAFTEGFATADLQAARRLIETLARPDAERIPAPAILDGRNIG